METKIRKLVADILQPVAEKSHNNSVDLKEQILKNEYLMRKVEEMDRSMKIDLNLRGTLADMKKRINTMDSDTSHHFSRLQSQLEQLQQTLTLSNEKFAVLSKEKNIFVTVKDHLQGEIRNFETLLQNFKNQLSEEIVFNQTETSMKMNEMLTSLDKLEEDNSTTRALVKNQMEQFTQIYFEIEIGKSNIEKLDKKLRDMPVYKQIEEIDEYLNKYMPFKIQNMIDDTLFNCLGQTELTKLAKYEQQAFTHLEINVKTKQSKLPKNEYFIPTKEQRKKQIAERINDKIKSKISNSRTKQDIIIDSSEQLSQNQRNNENLIVQQRRSSRRQSRRQSKVESQVIEDIKGFQEEDTIQINREVQNNEQNEQHIFEEEDDYYQSSEQEEKPRKIKIINNKKTIEMRTNEYGFSSSPQKQNENENKQTQGKNELETKRKTITYQKFQYQQEEQQLTEEQKEQIQQLQNLLILQQQPQTQELQSQNLKILSPQMSESQKPQTPQSPQSPGKQVLNQILLAQKEYIRKAIKKEIVQQMRKQSNSREDISNLYKSNLSQNTQIYSPMNSQFSNQQFHSSIQVNNQQIQNIFKKDPTTVLEDNQNSKITQKTVQLESSQINDDSQVKLNEEIKQQRNQSKFRKQPQNIQTEILQNDDNFNNQQLFNEGTQTLDGHVSTKYIQTINQQDIGTSPLPREINSPNNIPLNIGKQIAQKIQNNYVKEDDVLRIIQEKLNEYMNSKVNQNSMNQNTFNDINNNQFINKKGNDLINNSIRENSLIKPTLKEQISLFDNIFNESGVIKFAQSNDLQPELLNYQRNQSPKLKYQQQNSKEDNLSQANQNFEYPKDSNNNLLNEKDSYLQKKSQVKPTLEPTKILSQQISIQNIDNNINSNFNIDQKELKFNRQNNIKDNQFTPTNKQLKNSQNQKDNIFQQDIRENKNDFSTMNQAISQPQLNYEILKVQQQQQPTISSQNQSQQLERNQSEDTLITVDIIKDIFNQMKQLNDKILLIEQSFVQFRQDQQEDVGTFMARVSSYVKTESLKMNEIIEDMKGSFNEEVKRRKREKSELVDFLSHNLFIQLTELSSLEKKFDKGKEQIDKSLNQNQVFSKLLTAIVKALKIQQALDYQDDLDRESIFLMGLKESSQQQQNDFNQTSNQKLPQISSGSTNNKIKPKHFQSQPSSPKGQQRQVLSLDKNCLTCGQGGVPLAMRAFKIACLSYQPSQCFFEQGLLKRKQLIEIKGQLIDVCEDNLYNFDPTTIDIFMKKLLFMVNGSKPMNKTHVMPQAPVLQTQNEISGFDGSDNQMLPYSKFKELKYKAKVSVNQSANNILENIRTRTASRRVAASFVASDNYILNKTFDVDSKNLQIEGTHYLSNTKDELNKYFFIQSQANSPTNSRTLLNKQIISHIPSSGNEFTDASYIMLPSTFQKEQTDNRKSKVFQKDYKKQNI